MSMTPTIVALDVGERRIGVALANMEARMASPLMTLDRQEYSDIYARIKQLITEHNVQTVVVGLPRGMQGQETQQTASTREFARELEDLCNVTVQFQDEAGTSLLAKEELNTLKKNYDKGDVDKLAATYILRDWLQNAEVVR